MAATAEPKVKTSGTELLATLGEQELSIAEAVTKFGAEAMARAWAAGEIEFGHTKHIVAGSPGFAPHEDPLRDRQRLGATLIVETGMEWSGEKTRFHGRFKDVLRDAVFPTAEFYQVYRQEVCIDRKRDVWRLLEAGEAAGKRELRWMRVEVKREEAEKEFQWLVRLTDKGLSKLIGD